MGVVSFGLGEGFADFEEALAQLLLALFVGLELDV